MSFLERLLIKSRHDPLTGCLEWQGALDSSGYGSIGYRGKQWSTHRAIYTLLVTDIPENLQVMHLCDNPRCLNPNHLMLGTHKDNMFDMQKKGRKAILTGERHPRVKLTDKQVEYIKTDTTESISELACRFLVSKSLVRKVKTGERRNGFKK